MFVTILFIILPVFLVIILGYIIRRGGLVDDHFVIQLNRLTYFVALPALLFYKIGSTDFASSFDSTILAVLATSIVLTFLLAYGYGRWRRYPPARLGAFCQGSFRGNLAYVGLAVVYNAYGEEGFASAGILIGFLVPLLNFLAVAALMLPHRRSGLSAGFTTWAVHVAVNPLIIASLLGIVWSYFDLSLPEVIDRTFAIVTSMSLPLALLGIGASFSFVRLRGDLRPAVLATCLKLLIQPLAAAIMLVSCSIGGQDLGIAVIFAGTPTATAAYIMARELRCDSDLSSVVITLSTLLSALTYTLALYLLSHLGL